VSKEWRHPNSLKPKKFCAQSLVGKVMLTLFWDSKGLILEHYMSKGTTVTSSSYCDLLVNHLKPAVIFKHCGLLTTGVLLLHDNARPHTAYAMVAKIKDFHFECLHHPLYLTDLAPSNFHVFGA
jgi:histone-lysine N-methyltransferase SETMAR